MTFVSRSLKLLDRAIMKLEEIILSWSIIMIAVMIVGNVLSRTFFGTSWSFHQEVSQFAVIIATFMGISYAARKGRHISMSAFYDLAPFKIRKALSIFIPALTAIILFTFAYFAYHYMISVYHTSRVTTALQVPAYLMSVFIPVGFTLGGIQFLRNMWINIKEKDVYLAMDRKDYT
ncbi:TRAP transporter small permease [Halalkalibacterium halodurans]|nr:TRAP transporter small permease [Halalkalibacterium halodurans]TPE68315.1 TRAP transporter small permease [Halalkalibacterium halodurans]